MNGEKDYFGVFLSFNTVELQFFNGHLHLFQVIFYDIRIESLLYQK